VLADEILPRRPRARRRPPITDAEQHGAHTIEGLAVRVAQRLLALAACLWHNWQIHQPGRHLTAYDH
jgi:hypothetical protein